MHRKHVLRTGYLLTIALLCAETCATAAPGEVSSLSTERVSPKTYRLRWQPPESTNGVLRFYHLEIQMLDFDGFICRGIPLGEKLNASTPANETSFEAGSMIPSARYRISIRATTIADGPWRRLNLTTEKEVPEGPPREMRLISITERSARVSWRQPDCRLINGPITGYLTIRTTSAPWVPSEVQEDVNEPVLEMDALIPFTEYTLTVWARNSIGVGPGDSITFTTAPGVPPPPRNLTVYSATNVRLAVRWMPPYPQNGELERYLVYYQLVVGSSKPGMLYLTPAKAVCDSEARAGEHCTVLSNLHPNRRYHVIVSAKNKDVLKWSRWSNLVTAETRELVPRQEPTSSGATVTAVIVCVLILVVVAMAAVWKRRKQTIRKLPRSTSQTPAAPASDAASLSAVEENELNFEVEDMSGGGSETTSKPLPVSGLQEHVLRMLACDGLKSEFINLRKRRQYLTTEAQKIENDIKNSYGNLLPYDHSLVKLEPFTGVSQSEYINASYIDGYCRPNRYIATQGPDPHTVGDFWRMIWQENVCKIVMLTGVVEKGSKTKCQRYWPGNRANYGDIKVDFVTEENFSDYTIRELHMKLADTSREVKHFHFTSWPDHDVPLHPKPVLNFRDKVNEYKTFHGAPVVVYCSAGIGSTGAYILLDNLLDQAQAEGVVDVVGQLSAMRQERMNVVETLEQYTFVHRALVESVCFRDHSVPCSQMYDRYGELMSHDVTTGKRNIVKEFEELQSLTPCSKPADFTATGACANVKKSRDTSALASERCSPLLRNEAFANAVYINGFQKKNKFLVTQTPTSKDVVDFWKLVIESGARTIVTLDAFSDKEDIVPFWPIGGSAQYDNLRVEWTEDLQVNGMSVRVLKITSTHKASGPSRPVTVKHFHRTTWKKAERMVELLDQVERWQQQSEDKVILVQCRNGWLASGLFCCCALVLEKLKSDQEVDVLYATRIVREYRPQFISDCNQYKLCYDTAVVYLESFEMYSNFGMMV